MLRWTGPGVNIRNSNLGERTQARVQPDIQSGVKQGLDGLAGAGGAIPAGEVRRAAVLGRKPGRQRTKPQGPHAGTVCGAKRCHGEFPPAPGKESRHTRHIDLVQQLYAHILKVISDCFQERVAKCHRAPSSGVLVTQVASALPRSLSVRRRRACSVLWMGEEPRASSAAMTLKVDLGYLLTFVLVTFMLLL